MKLSHFQQVRNTEGRSEMKGGDGNIVELILSYFCRLQIQIAPHSVKNHLQIPIGRTSKCKQPCIQGQVEFMTMFCNLLHHTFLIDFRHRLYRILKSYNILQSCLYFQMWQDSNVHCEFIIY